MQPIDIAFQLLKMLKQGFKMTPDQLKYYAAIQQLNEGQQTSNPMPIIHDEVPSTMDLEQTDEEKRLRQESQGENRLPADYRGTIAVGRHPNSLGE